MIRLVLCEAKRDCDPEDAPRWVGWVRVKRVEGTRIWFEPPPMRAIRAAAIRRGDVVGRNGRYGRLPGRYWHFRLRPETMISMCDECHTQTLAGEVE